MPSTDTFGEIKGLPAGATVEPIVASNGTIRGLPKGAVVEPISKTTEAADSSRVNQPFSAADEKKFTTPVAGLPQGASLHPVQPTPQEKLYQSTVSEGQSAERAQKRVDEYNYAIRQGLSPERAQQFASNLQWNDTTPKVMTGEETQALADNVRAMSEEDRKKAGIYVNTSTLFGNQISPDEFAKGYAEARARGMSDEDAVEYGSSNTVQRAMMRAGQWAAPKWTNFKAGILHVLGANDTDAQGKPFHVSTQEVAEAPLVATISGQTRQDYAYLTYKEADWIDKHLGKVAGSLDAHLHNLIAGLTTPDMAAIEIASAGTGAVESALPEVGTELTAAARATRFTQRAVRTTTQLAHAGFTAQMATGTAQSFGSAWNEGKQGNVSEALGYTLDGLVNGLMAVAGTRAADAHTEVRHALDETTSKVYPDKKFSQLSDKQQALMVQKLIDDDPQFREAAGVSQKEMQKNARKLQQRYSEGLSQTWNPKASSRIVTDLHAERAETARKEQVQKVLDTLKAKIQERTDELKKQAEESVQFAGARRTAIEQAREDERRQVAESRQTVQQTAEEISKGREETFANRQAIGEVPTEEETSRSVEAESDESGHVTYPVQYWGETNKFGVGTDGDKHAIYRQTPRGVEWLDRNGNFTETPESLYFNADPQTSDTVARLSSLKLAADGLAAQPEASAEEVKDAATLGEIRQQLIDGEIDTAEAQKRANIAEKVKLPDVHMAARDGRLNGPFSEKSATEYASEVESSLRESEASEEEIAATLESLPELARAQTESNLHHVYRSGDYIVAKDGVKWTLDANGMLYPSDGRPATPLMKRGLYSPKAIQLAASGRIGYGMKTREDARATDSRNRELRRGIAGLADFDREMRIAQQNAGLGEENITGQRADEAEKSERREKFLGRPPVTEDIRKAREQRRAAYKASSDPNNVINQLAKQFGTTPDEVMRIGLSESQPGTPEGKAASLEVGDRVSDPFRPDRPWIVEEKNGQTSLRSGQANPIAFDRLNPSRRVLQILEKGDITHDRDWTAEEKEKVAFEKPYLVHQRLLADAVRDQEGKPTPEPKTHKQADEAVVQAEARKDATASIAVADAVEALNPRANATEEEINKNVEKAAQSRKLVKVAVSQKAKAEGKAAPKGDFPAYAPMPKEGSGEAVVITQGEESHPAHYYLVKLRGVITSHFWNGNKIEIEPRYAPKAMQKRIFDDAKTEEVFSEASPERFRLADFLQAYNGPERGTPILEDGGRAIGGNTRLLRLKKWLENIRRQGGDSADAGIALFRDRMRTFARSVGIKDVPIDDEDYVVVRILDNPIRTNEDAVKLGSLFNDPTSSQVDEAVEAVTNATYLKEANARETAEGKPGILTEIGRAIAGDSVSTVRQAIDSNPIWFAEVAKDYFHIPDTQNSDWFENGEGGRVLSLKGKDKFELALLSTHLPNAESVSKIVNTAPAGALGKAIGTVTALNAFPDRDLSGKITEAVEAIIETQRFRKYSPTGEPGDKPGVAWNKAYAIQNLAGIGEETPPEPDIVTRTIYQALLDRKTTRLNAALKDLIAGQSAGMDFLLAPEVEGKKLETPAELFNSAFEPELKEIAHQEGKKGDFGITQQEFDAALQGRELGDEERNKDLRRPETQSLRRRINQLTGEEKNKLLLTSRVTGLPNLQDFEEHNDLKYGGTPSPVVGRSDVDGLKAFNDTYGYEAGNQLLRAKADAIRQVGVEAYHEKGDEFLYRSTDPIQLSEKLKQAQQILKDTTITVEKNGKKIPYKGISFSFGLGKDLDEAEVEQKRSKAARIQSGERAERGKLTPPPKSATPADLADRKIAAVKTEQGYVTPQQLRSFLDTNPATKDHASELMRTAQMMAEFVYDSDPPVGVDKKQALDWILRERVGKIEAGERKGVRGEYVDPRLEKGIANGILKLHKAADATSFIHEFSHVIFPFLSDEDLKAIDTIGERKVWDGSAGSLKGESYAALSEKLAHGMERFLRDQNPRDFSAEVGKVLAKIKGIFRRVYLQFRRDPLAPYTLGSDSVELFDRMFHIEGSDVPDVWREEVKRARAAEEKIVKPEEQPHPVVKLARELGGTGLRESIDGKVVDEVGDRVDPKKATAVISFPTEAAAVKASTSPKVKGGQIIEGKDGTWGVKINTTGKVPKGSLFQGLPERHPGLQLEDLEKRLKDTPAFKTFERRLLQMQIDNLKNRIRADHGVEPMAPKTEPELPKQVIQEAKNVKTTDRGRAANDDAHELPQPPRVGGIPKPPQLGLSGHGAAERRGPTPRSAVPRAPVSLENVKPVGLQPLSGVRGEPVGAVAGEKFDQKAWVEGLKRAGLPESTPPPTYSLDPKVAAQLIYPGQKQIVQTVMSALDQGDGAAIITPPGSGKTFTSSAIIKEFLGNKPDARVLVISKNRSLLKKSKRVAANTFGFDVELDAPEGQPGVYGASYMGLLNNDIYKNSKWDLVVADESGEARRWYDEETKQGQMLRDVMANSGKGVYLSATPFHSPMEYGYLDKLNLWPKGQFDKWIQENFAHEKVGDKIIARLDPSKQAKLREQLIARGQFVSQAISYDGYNAHFGVVPVTDSMKRGLDRIREGFSRARDQFVQQGKQGLAKKTAAFEAIYTKNFLERERLPQAIELAKQARAQGWRVLIFSEHTADDLFRRERAEGEEASTYQQLDDAMGGQLSRIIPPYPSIYDELFAEFGTEVGDYSGRGNTDAAREKARTDFLKGDISMLYSSYAGGGIGVDIHDADYPELNVKGGDRPIVALYLGPPYSGVLLEQAMGRPWRFGVKSDVHAVFLATDSEPDIRLMQTKVGPRMKALRAAVLGERDSLGSVMSTYTDEEKVRERQDQLAFAEGNEMKVNATQFQVRSKQRNVGIQDWSAITFPSAEEAKNKGMRYGEAVAGGDWSSLYQSKFELRPPDDPNTAKAKETIDRIGNTVASGNGVPEELQSLDPVDRKTAVGLASATATSESELPIDADKQNLAKYSMDSSLRQGAIVPYIGITFSQEVGMVNIARLDGKQEVGYNLRRMNRAYGADWDQRSAQSWQFLRDSFERQGIEPTDENVREMSLVLEGKRITADPKMEGLVNDIRDMMKMAHEDMGKAGVKVTAGKKLIPYTDFPDDPNYFPHRIDFDYEMEDPTKPGEKIKVKDLLKIDERRAKAILDRVPELKPYSFQQIMDHLERNHPRTVKQINVHFAREVNFPFIKRDYSTLLGYFDQVAQSISAAKNFGPEEEKLNEQIKKIRNASGRETLNSMFRSALQPQNWEGTSSRLYNAIIAYEGATKMTFAAPKVPFHLVHVPMVMKGRVMPLIKAFKDVVFHPREVFDNAAYVGTITRQSRASEMLFGERDDAMVRGILKKEGFEAAYKLVRVISGQAAKNYLDVWAMRDLRKGGRSAEHTKRMLQDVFLLGDKGIDEAVDRGRFTPEEISRAQVAFTNMAAFSGRGDPLQMPKWARLEQPKIASYEIPVIAKMIRLTYSLQSFSVKTLSALREHLFDEVVVHGNLKPLRYAVIAYPLVGTALNLVNTGGKHLVQRGLEGLTGRKHMKDSWDNYLAYLEDTFEHPDAVKFLKWYIDSYALSAALETTKIVADHFLDMVTGRWQKSDEYWIPDLIQHIVGPFFEDLYSASVTENQLEKTEHTKHPPGWKHPREAKEIRHGLEQQVPALRALSAPVDWVERKFGINPPPK